MHNRLLSLRSLMRERSIEAIYISAAANRRYLSGFTGSAGSLLITEDVAVLFTDFRYRLQAAEQAPDFVLREITLDTPLHTLLSATVAELGISKLAIESEHLSVAQFHRFVQTFEENGLSPRPALVRVEGLVEGLRSVKSNDELASLYRAVEITDAALEAVLPALRPEHTERQVAWTLENAIRERGADGVSFPIIVAAGERSALPHVEPGNAILGLGQPIVIDMGACFAGYHADLTRTIVLGEPDAYFWRIYNIVLQAQQHAIDALRPGMTGGAADALARDQIDEAGFGEVFGHGLGHGVGLSIHEAPALRRGSEQLLQAGQVFSVEPGIYLSDWGGVRIEDLVLLTESGSEVLSRAPRHPLVVNRS
jgi:Xaa-Pro aminopeptidase